MTLSTEPPDLEIARNRAEAHDEPSPDARVHSAVARLIAGFIAFLAISLMTAGTIVGLIPAHAEGGFDCGAPILSQSSKWDQYAQDQRVNNLARGLSGASWDPTYEPTIVASCRRAITPRRVTAFVLLPTGAVVLIGAAVAKHAATIVERDG